MWAFSKFTLLVLAAIGANVSSVSAGPITPRAVTTVQVKCSSLSSYVLTWLHTSSGQTFCRALIPPKVTTST